jgi:hypothetical protein
MSITRRQFGRVALAGVPAVGVALRGTVVAAGAQAAAPMSRWSGVQVGLNPTEAGELMAGIVAKL